MPARAKVELLPDDIREQLEQRLIANGFGGYVALAAWLAEQGFEIGKSSVQRWGDTFEQRVRALKISTDQAKAIVEASPDDQGAMNEALMRLTQEKLFNVLLDMQVDPDSIDVTKLARAIAELTKGSIAQKKFAVEAAARAREQLLAEQADRLKSMVKKRGMSAETANEIRSQILGIAQ